MTFKYDRLLGRIVEKFGTQYNFSIAMGLSKRTISLKLNNKRRWTDEDIAKAAGLLDIQSSEIHEYFFVN